MRDIQKEERIMNVVMVVWMTALLILGERAHVQQMSQDVVKNVRLLMKTVVIMDGSVMMN